MNERIRELWDRAAESAAAYPSGQNNSWQTQVNFMDKFAELIVQDCADLCESFGESGDGYTCSAEILEHFGVDQ